MTGVPWECCPLAQNRFENSVFFSVSLQLAKKLSEYFFADLFISLYEEP